MNWVACLLFALLTLQAMFFIILLVQMSVLGPSNGVDLQI